MAYQKAWKEARSFLWNMGLQDTFPVPLSELVREMNVDVRYIEACAIDGIALRSCGKSIVLLKKGTIKNRRRFTLAHELAHIALHHPLSLSLSTENLSSKNQLETEANIWAAEILMPIIPLKRIAHLYNKNELASMFGVSTESMHWRLKKLGIGGC